MRVAIDSGPLSSGHAVRGVGFSTKYLIDAIQRNNKDKSLKVDSVDFSITDLEKYDVLHATSFNPFFVTLPISYIEKTVVTIHDLIPLIYPKVYAPGLKGKISVIRNENLLKIVKAIITVSETSKKDIVRFFGIDQNKINVIYWGSRFGSSPDKGAKDVSFVKKKYKLPIKFILYVGDINYNKNIPILAEACRISGITLVIVGKQARETDGLEYKLLKSLKGPQDFLRYLLDKPHPELLHIKKLKKIFESGNILRLGFIPTNELAAIYSLATCYVQPSLYEGFGLPVLEAIACETPVIVSKTQALMEITKGNVDSFSPSDSKELSNKINNVLNNPKDSKKLKGLHQEFSKYYSWDKTAEEHLKLYRNLSD